MLGAIIGDIVGSRFEFDNHKSKDFELFHRTCDFTDDTVMTVAIAESILSSSVDCSRLPERAVETMQRLGREYEYRGYGIMFGQWIYSDDPKPYNSFGNGAAMRVSPCGFAARTIEEAKDLAYRVTAVTHNHPEGLKGAEAVAVAVFLAKSGYDKFEIGDYIHARYYKMDFSINEIRDTYFFNETCQDTVPQAIMAFLDSTDFEDAIRTAISVGGDSDTLAAITGGIAEAYYGIPEDIKEKALSYLDSKLLRTVLDFERKYCTPVQKKAPDLYDLERFIEAQEQVYDQALREIKGGEKRSHWIWYVFPQLKGLGYSEIANKYGISSLDEAKAYMEHPILSSRLIEITEALLALRECDPVAVLGGIDAMKLRSSLTLFALISEPDSVFHRALAKLYHGERDNRTLELLGMDKGSEKF